MFEKISDYFLGAPGRITQLGAWITKISSILLFAAAVGQIVTRASNVLLTLAPQMENTKRLADIYPTLPLWWVPESWIGVIVALALIASGISINAYGKNIDRIFE